MTLAMVSDMEVKDLVRRIDGLTIEARANCALVGLAEDERNAAPRYSRAWFAAGRKVETRLLVGQALSDRRLAALKQAYCLGVSCTDLLDLVIPVCPKRLA